MTVVATELLQVLWETTYFLANPSNLGLISSHGLGVGDLNAPAALRLSVDARYYAEADEGVMKVLR